MLLYKRVFKRESFDLGLAEYIFKVLCGAYHSAGLCVLSAVLKIAKKSLVDIFTTIIFIAVTALSFFTDLSPVVFIINAAVCGLLIKISKEKKAKGDDK